MAGALPVARDDRYLKLVRAFPLRPIRSVKVHQRAKATLRGLAGERGAAVSDYRQVLISLIEEYEQNAGHRIDTSNVTAAQIVKHLLAENGLSVNAFAERIDVSQSALSDMLNGKRDWSKSAIIRIADYFRLQPGLFLR